MKKLLLASALIFVSLFSFAQSLAQEPPKFIYCEVVGATKLLSMNKVNITIDFGQDMKWYQDNRLKDPKTGKSMTFNSMIDALNYMGKQGWAFEQAYAVTLGNQNVYHYLLRKPFEELDEEEKAAVLDLEG